jgi:hypothetical protein
MRFSMLRLLGGAVIAVWLLTGCASGYLLDNTVQSFSQFTALPAQPTYRFERLPSQQDPWHAQLEAMADPALHKAGLRRDDANPRYSVQVGAQLQRVLSPWANPWYGWGTFGVSHRGYGLGFGFPFGYGYMEPPWYQREVSIIIRELPSNRAVYETRALNSGPWVDDGAVFPVMFQAALQGFPTPPPGPRRVDIQVAR